MKFLVKIRDDKAWNNLILGRKKENEKTLNAF